MKILFSQELIYREREREISTTLNCSEKGVSFSFIYFDILLRSIERRKIYYKSNNVVVFVNIIRFNLKF